MTIHSHINSRSERLHKCQRRSQIKHPVRAAKFVRHHRPGQHNRLPWYVCPSTAAVCAIVSVPCVITIRSSAHSEQRGQNQLPAPRRSSASCRSSSEPQYRRPKDSAPTSAFPPVSILKKQLARKLVVFLIECPASNQDLDPRASQLPILPRNFTQGFVDGVILRSVSGACGLATGRSWSADGKNGFARPYLKP